MDQFTQKDIETCAKAVYELADMLARENIDDMTVERMGDITAFYVAGYSQGAKLEMDDKTLNRVAEVVQSHMRDYILRRVGPKPQAGVQV